ncbi:hypothetical protein GC163_10645 [bacterium]|nr:hypothetical protein [bacterium]
MSRWKLVVVAVLSLLPLLLFAGFGAVALYRSGNWFWIWWTLPVCWGLSAWLGRQWSRDLQLPLPRLENQHWTMQDHAATAIVQAEQARIDSLSPEQLTDPQFYAQLTQQLALKLARHYHPHAQDPLEQRSVVEILAVIQLVSEDVEEWFLKYVPASHLITVKQWKLLSQAPKWWQTASNAGWVASIALNPLNLGRFIASRVALEPFTKQLQQNLLGSFYAYYVRQAGYYLIELNSGRLRAGSKRYREVMQRLHPEPAATAVPEIITPQSGDTHSRAPVTITLAVIGQVKAGKSSLVNCLLGGQKAETDVLPATQMVQRYTLNWPERSESLVILDTPGYSDAGATATQLHETQQAVQTADLVLLVLDVRSPARDADITTLKALSEWYATQPRLRPPKILIVLNKMDGLSPMMEWQPPYNWKSPTSNKEKNIAAARAYAREVFGNTAVDFIPVCADREHRRDYGISQDLIPAISDHLDQARGNALLNGLHNDYERDKVRQVVQQTVAIGKQLFQAVDQWRNTGN